LVFTTRYLRDCDLPLRLLREDASHRDLGGRARAGLDRIDADLLEVARDLRHARVGRVGLLVGALAEDDRVQRHRGPELRDRLVVRARVALGEVAQRHAADRRVPRIGHEQVAHAHLDHDLGPHEAAERAFAVREAERALDLDRRETLVPARAIVLRKAGADRADELDRPVVAEETDLELAHLAHVAGHALAERDDDHVHRGGGLDLVREPALAADDDALEFVAEDPLAVARRDELRIAALGEHDAHLAVLGQAAERGLEPRVALLVGRAEAILSALLHEVERVERERELALGIGERRARVVAARALRRDVRDELTGRR
jgi:hypothetical protein